MRQLDENLWVHDDIINNSLRLRMTIVRLCSGGLWLHSPTPISADLQSEVDRLGSISALVAPNNAHNLFLADWMRAYPQAVGYVAKGIPHKRPDLADCQLIDEAARALWSDDLDMAVMTGVPLFDECVFLHRASRSLIVTDLVQNYRPQAHSGLAEKIMRNLILKPLGWKDICIAPPLRFDFVVEDRPALESFMNGIGEWSFDRIIVTHGDLIETDAAAIYAELCARLTHLSGSGLRAFAVKQFVRFATR